MSYGRLVGVGGIGTGLFFALEGDHDLGRNESRPARRQDVRDYCKLHIIAHYPAALLAPRGFQVLPLGRVGDDDEGSRLRREMAAAGMDVRFVRQAPGRPTLLSVCFQYPDGSGGNLTTSDSAAAALRPEDVDEVAAFVDAGTVVLAAPEAPLAARRRLLERGGAAGALRVAGFTGAELRGGEARALLTLADLVSLNHDEAAVLAGRPFVPAEAASFCAAAAFGTSIKHLLVTVGAAGAFAWSGGVLRHVPALPVVVASTAGAGDALLGGVIAGLAAERPLLPDSDRPLGERPVDSALDLGVALAAYAVASPHTIPAEVSWGELALFLGKQGVSLAPVFQRYLQAAA